MITRINGKLLVLGDDWLWLEVGPLEYEVLIPEFTRARLQDKIGSEISLFTVQYLDGNPTQGRLTPRIVGFLTKIEREFFSLFCSVDGVGVKKALRAMVRPVREIAEAIEEQDAKQLSSLPGIGPAVADRIIAKLRRKMSKFALIVGQDEPQKAAVGRDVMTETFEALRAVGHSEADARRLLDNVLAGSKKKYKSVEELLQAVWQQSR